MSKLSMVSLETLSPRELCLYLSLWAAEREEDGVLIQPTFQKFLFAARGCQVIAEMQVNAIDERGPEFGAWIHALALIDASIASAEEALMQLTDQQLTSAV